MGVAVALAIPLTLNSLREGVIRASGIFDLLITAKGSPTQAVLNTLFLQEAPLGNIPYSLYQKLSQDYRTRRAIPLGFGDNYNGFPLVGTTAGFFELREKRSHPPFYRTRQGRLFKGDFEAVLGAQAARVTGLKLGDQFSSAHGMVPALEEQAHSDKYTVVGILAPTGAPGDRGIYASLESIWEVHHEAVTEAHQDEHQREVTAILYTPKQLGYVYQLASTLKDGKEAQGVFPGQVIGRMLDLMGQGRAGYAVIGSLVLLMALATVAVNTYAAAVAGQRNLAVLRAIGAKNATVLGVVLLEACVIAGAGVLLGLLLAYAGTLLAGQLVSQRVGLVLPLPMLEASDLLRALLILPVAVLFSLTPALLATKRSPLANLSK
jgi:putative ABC transport system permease protein